LQKEFIKPTQQKEFIKPTQQKDECKDLVGKPLGLLKQ
jgi:hypothetical protein